MSSIGFAPRSGSEVEQLRSAYKSLNDVTRNLASVAKCVKNQDLKMAEHHLRAAEWHLGQAKRIIADVGQAKRK
jgi:ferritin-like metal-binding protein YciE